MADINTERKVSIIDPSIYSQQVIATAIAMFSRVERTLGDSLQMLTEAQSDAFFERFIVGYGHGSVAEHAVLHIGVEGLSRYATEQLEWSRLASYTEKSTRYRRLGIQQTYKSTLVIGSPEASVVYSDTLRAQFGAYDIATELVRPYMVGLFPRKPDEKEQAYESRIRTKCMDVCRFGLPRATLADTGMTANVRVFEAVCARLLSHQLLEVRETGEEIRQAAMQQAPILFKYSHATNYLEETNQNVKDWVVNHLGESPVDHDVKPDAHLVEFDPEGEEKFFATWLFKFGGGKSYMECREKVKLMSQENRDELALEILGKLELHDKGGRELERLRLVYDLELDYGSYYDLKRNRPLTPEVQEIDGKMGVILPAVLYELGCGDQMELAMREAIDAARFVEDKVGHGEGGYLYSNGTMMRMLMDMGLRELVDIWKLRAAPQAHPAYRILVLKMGELAEKVYPTLWKHLTKHQNFPTSQEIYNSFYERSNLE
ncbi:MAG: FAD-dependent thymidylate synthase [Patescibacteria group bacterium]